MIPVKRGKKPANFDTDVLQPGLRAIAEMVGKPPLYPRTAGKPFKKIANRKCDIPSDKFPPYWTGILDDLMIAYQEVCAYSCFRIHPVTGGRSVDHFAPKSKKWSEVYKWSNYRLCCSRLNSRKNNLAGVADPLKIKRDWFQLELTGFQVVPDFSLDPALVQSIQDTITVLGLDDFRRDRERDAERYWSKDCSLKVLREESPFVAYELYRQGRLRAGDVWI